MIKKELLVLAIGGNALLQRGESLEYSYMQKNINIVSKIISETINDYNTIIVHGNGPQVGLLSLQSHAYGKVRPYPFDILNAESQGMIGYLLQQTLANYMPNISITTVVTQVLVDRKDQAFKFPTKFIGPVYNKQESTDLNNKHGWIMKKDGKFYRRVVASPKPIDIIEMDSISTLINANTVVIAGGGGGIPCIKDNTKLRGIEAVVDKDYTAALLAKRLKASRFVILTDVDAVYDNFSTPESKPIREIDAATLRKYKFPLGSMQPKIDAVCDFVSSTNRTASIGSFDKLVEILNGRSGTLIK